MNKKTAAQIIIQSISNVVFIESVLISRTLNVPPAIPLPQILKQANRQAQNLWAETTAHNPNFWGNPHF
jgi:hypothetical protein